MSKETEIQALISLLDDENDVIVDNVSKKLLSFGVDVVEKLDIALDSTVDPLINERLDSLIKQIHFNSTYIELKDWISDSYQDLLEGYLIVSKFEYPDIDIKSIETKIESFKQKIWLELNNDLTPLEKINIFNHVFYNILEFKGDYKAKPEKSDYHINKIIETKKGNSISLGILYIILANELNLQVYGVRLVKHFVLSYQNNFIFDFSLDNELDVMFYINPITKGTIFERNEITNYLKKMNLKKESIYFSPSENKFVIKELLIYIKTFYKNNFLEYSKIDELLDLF